MHTGIIHETFSGPIDPRWTVHQVGRGLVQTRSDGLWFTLPAIQGNTAGYHDAQITDYAYPPGVFQYRPPLRLTVTARATAAADQLVGTAGFGFWNHPFSPEIRRLPRLPRVVWFFFASPPNNMALAAGVPGSGWKAATLDAGRPGALAMIPAALPLMLAMRVPRFSTPLWAGIQRRLCISEKLLAGDLLAARHTYALEWTMNGARFFVDDRLVHESPYAPRGACGFIAWMDNQYAIATPQGRLGFGVIPVPREQSLILETLTIEPLERRPQP
ncbi:MAG: hypothetical protein IPK19_02030 [Chloroflexi bacterium]|nr:hypothetical protein [Chloroflexota bacterium]